MDGAVLSGLAGIEYFTNGTYKTQSKIHGFNDMNSEVDSFGMGLSKYALHP